MTTSLNIYSDGGARGNPGPAAFAFVVKDISGNVVDQSTGYIGIATNNVAEYHGALAATKWLLEYAKKNQNTISQVTYFFDSQLVTNQLAGLYKIKNVELGKLIIEIKKIQSEINSFLDSPKKISYVSIPREKNSEADFLLNQTLDKLS